MIVRIGKAGDRLAYPTVAQVKKAYSQWVRTEGRLVYSGSCVETCRAPDSMLLHYHITCRPRPHKFKVPASTIEVCHSSINAGFKDIIAGCRLSSGIALQK